MFRLVLNSVSKTIFSDCTTSTVCIKKWYKQKIIFLENEVCLKKYVYLVSYQSRIIAQLKKKKSYHLILKIKSYGTFFAMRQNPVCATFVLIVEIAMKVSNIETVLLLKKLIMRTIIKETIEASFSIFITNYHKHTHTHTHTQISMCVCVCVVCMMCLCVCRYSQNGICCTVELHYNKVLGTMKITVLYQVSHYIRVKKKK